MKKVLELHDITTNMIINRKKIYDAYYYKYFNLYMNRFNIIGLDYQQKNFIFRRFWKDGRVACYKIPNSEGVEYENGLLIFTPYAPTTFNIYDYPVDAQLINLRGVKFIPSRRLKCDKEVVLGYIQHSKKGLFQIVDFYLSKITDIEMVIQTNLKAHKTPWIIGVSPESEYKMRQLWENLEKDYPNLFVDIEDAQNCKSLVSGANYIIDKLYEYKVALENELKEYLGINNMGTQEKKEHLITSEVEANNEIVASSGDCFLDVLKDFIERINEVFGQTLKVELNEPVEYYSEEEESEEEEDNENE